MMGSAHNRRAWGSTARTASEPAIAMSIDGNGRRVAADPYRGAVEAVPAIVPVVEQLVAAGHAYRVETDTYFSVAADPLFGQVSHLDREQMTALFAERGGDPERAGKRDPLDFVLCEHSTDPKVKIQAHLKPYKA